MKLEDYFTQRTEMENRFREAAKPTEEIILKIIEDFEGRIGTNIDGIDLIQEIIVTEYESPPGNKTHALVRSGLKLIKKL